MSTAGAENRFQRTIAYLGLGLVALLVVTATAAVLGAPWAWQATTIIVMAGAVLLGVRAASSRQSTLQVLAAILLLFGGSYGIVRGLVGGDPFQEWSVLGPVAIGVALTFFVDEQPSRQN